MAEINYEKLEAFLKGEVSLGDLETRWFNRYDKTAIAYALVVAHLDKLSCRIGDEFVLEEALSRTLRKYCPYVLTCGNIDASRALGFHEGRGRGFSTVLRLPDQFIELVNQYKDAPEGGIAKFTALKLAQERGGTGQDGITPDSVARDVVARLRCAYGGEVLNIIRRTL